MKFEKLTNNKIRIIFSLQDMKLNNISAQAFLSDRLISQKILQNILLEAEKEIGFKTEDSKLLVEAIKSPEGGFIFTITKLVSQKDENVDTSSNMFIKFDNFDNFYCLCTYINNLNYPKSQMLLKNFSLILYNGTYYLRIFNFDNNLPTSVINALSEFGEVLPFSPELDGTLHEYGKIIFNKNAINKCLKYY